MKRPQLLLIDDEPALADFVANAARECGFDPTVTSNDMAFLDPEPSERVHQANERLGCALRQFEHQPIGRNAHCAAHSLDKVGEIEALKAYGGNIEGEARL